MKRTRKPRKDKSNKILGFIEKNAVIISGIIVLIILYLNIPIWSSIPKIDLILGSLITVVVTLIGVLITSLTILIAIMNTRSVKEICRNNLWRDFINYFISPIVLGIILMIYIIYTMSILKTITVHKAEIISISSLLTMFMIGILRVGYILVVIMKQIPVLDYSISDNKKCREIDKDDFKNNLK